MQDKKREQRNCTAEEGDCLREELTDSVEWGKGDFLSHGPTDIVKIILLSMELYQLTAIRIRHPTVHSVTKTDKMDKIIPTYKNLKPLYLREWHPILAILLLLLFLLLTCI